MKFKYLKEYSEFKDNFEKHPEEKYKGIINRKSHDEEISNKKEIDILSDSGFEKSDLEDWSKEEVDDMFNAWKEDSKEDLEEEEKKREEIDPDLRDKK